jgi:hypothetical protein
MVQSSDSQTFSDEYRMKYKNTSKLHAFLKMIVTHLSTLILFENTVQNCTDYTSYENTSLGVKLEK